jgi:hypothetical protein
MGGKMLVRRIAVGGIVTRITVLLLLGACASPAPGIENADIRVDSAQAVALAVDAYAKVDPDLPVNAVEVTRDDDGFLVSLLPSGVMLGGGGLVRVAWNGRARLVRKYE